MHYIPEVRGIEQVKGAIDHESDAELRSLEKRLEAAGTGGGARTSGGSAS